MSKTTAPCRMVHYRLKLTFASHMRLIKTIKWLALMPFTIILAAQHYSELSADALPKNELLAMEKEATGIYMSGHPMDEYQEIIKSNSCLLYTSDAADE